MNENQKNKPLLIFILMIIIVIVLWVINFLLLKDNCNKAALGDMFGGVNALFAGLAFAGLIYTILLQKAELELQRKELSQTRDEFKTQNETLKIQRFENTFFNMLDLHHRIVDGIDQSEKKKERTSGLSFRDAQYQFVTETYKGRDVFRNEYLRLNYLLQKNSSNENPLAFNELYINNYEHVQIDFGHYFRNVYRIIKLIDKTDFYPFQEDIEAKEILNYNERYNYTSILRAQLSDYELLWLFYNCLSSNGIDKFKPLIEKYSLFKNLPKDKLHDASVANEYNKGAYLPKNHCA